MWFCSQHNITSGGANSKYFEHDEIIIGSVEELEPNFFKASATVNQSNFFCSRFTKPKRLCAGIKQDSLSIKTSRLHGRTLCLPQRRMIVGPPIFDPEESEGVVKPGHDLRI